MKRSYIIHLTILFMIAIPMLYYGLTAKNYDPTNTVRREGQTIHFATDSIALTEPGYALPHPNAPFLLEMTILPVYQEHPRFQFLFLLHNGRDESQFLIAQWGRQLVFMNGTDYSNSRKEAKLYVTLGKGNDPVNVRFTSDAAGTSVHIDGKLISKREDLILTAPPMTEKSRLLLGNSPNGTHSWTGTLYKIRVQGVPPKLLYPQKKPLLKKNFLLRPDLKEGGKAIMTYDIFINTMGFIPLGIVLPLLLYRSLNMKKRKAFLTSLLTLFFFSLFLETVQVWIPTRDSSALDLFLNTLGGTLGMVIVFLVLRIHTTK